MDELQPSARLKRYEIEIVTLAEDRAQRQFEYLYWIIMPDGDMVATPKTKLEAEAFCKLMGWDWEYEH